MSASTRVSPVIVRPADVAPQPWANGRGTTRVLAARPGWRISVAEIEGRMPFSPFLGADRLLIPLTPGGLALEINGSTARVPQYSAITFRGEDHVLADTGSARASVVNLMARRSSGRMQWAIHRVSGAIREEADAIVVLGGRVEVRGEAVPPGAVIRPGPRSLAVSPTEGVIAVMRVRENGRRQPRI
ncbi:HutD family protein [Microbacterium hydrocarbonoxydans]|jgi:environmental stress-induced protein Ves|uniref:HutD family protein n=1 Tax=Microbacterium hydrocarbonoxydans TaxID=273678 RepID=UPI003D98372C